MLQLLCMLLALSPPSSSLLVGAKFQTSMDFFKISEADMDCFSSFIPQCWQASLNDELCSFSKYREQEQRLVFC